MQINKIGGVNTNAASPRNILNSTSTTVKMSKPDRVSFGSGANSIADICSDLFVLHGRHKSYARGSILKTVSDLYKEMQGWASAFRSGVILDGAELDTIIGKKVGKFLRSPDEGVISDINSDARTVLRALVNGNGMVKQLTVFNSNKKPLLDASFTTRPSIFHGLGQRTHGADVKLTSPLPLVKDLHVPGYMVASEFNGIPVMISQTVLGDGVNRFKLNLKDVIW